MIKVAPSILSADFSRLGEEVKKINDAGAPYVHIDVMDGHYVPNITLGAQIIKSIRGYSNKIFDVHLMITNPEEHIKKFYEAGADCIIVHAETCNHLHKIIQEIKNYGIKAGVSINPHTPVSSIKHLIKEMDVVLIMTVNPGFGGQNFLNFTLDKIREVRKLSDKVDIEVDGGITNETGKLCVEAGANILVAGSYIFNGDYESKIKILSDL